MGDPMKGIRLAGQIISAFIIPVVFACGPGEPPALPPVSFKVEFTGHSIPGKMTIGQRMLADVSFKNVSTRTWPSKPNSEGMRAVNLSYHWLDKKGAMVVFDGLRTPLPHDLNPGESMQLKAAILAPDKRGKYTLEVTLVQEGVAWFPEEGGAKIVVPVKVVPSQTEVPAASSQKPRVSVGIPKAARLFPMQTRQDDAMTPQVAGVKTGSDRQSHPWTVQVASYSVEKEAQALAKRLKDNGYEPYITVAEVNGKKWYRVRVGHLTSRGEAEKLQKSIIGTQGFKHALVTNQ